MPYHFGTKAANREHGWDDAKVALLRQLWTEGLSGTQIAARIGGGHTRLSVIGKANRLKLESRASTVNRHLGGRRPQKPVQADLPEPAPVHTQALNIPLLDARNGQCRYPMWGEPDGAPEYHVCGLPIARWSYCEHHAERTLVKPKKPEGKE